MERVNNVNILCCPTSTRKIKLSVQEKYTRNSIRTVSCDDYVACLSVKVKKKDLPTLPVHESMNFNLIFSSKTTFCYIPHQYTIFVFIVPHLTQELNFLPVWHHRLGLLFFIHSQPALWEAQFLQWSGHLWAVCCWRGQHHWYTVLVQCQHRHGAFTQIQQQSHTRRENINRYTCKDPVSVWRLQPYVKSTPVQKKYRW